MALSPDHAADGPAGRDLLRARAPTADRTLRHLIMDRAYQGNATLQLALELGFTAVVPPTAQRRVPWHDDRVMYRKRNEVERLFRRLKGFRRIFSRFDKLDIMLLAFVHFAYRKTFKEKARLDIGLGDMYVINGVIRH